MNTRLLASLVLASGVATLAPLAAQVTTNSLAIGGAGAIGCQGSEDPPTLSEGVPASAQFDVTYDPATHRMTLTVTNTSDVVANQANPVLTRIFLNTPPGALTGALLVSQTGSGGANPDFELEFGAERAGCIGDFELSLETEHGVQGGVANAAAPWIGGPPGAAAIGPVTFVIDLVGPGAGNVNARALTYGYSENGARDPVHAAAKFQAGGATATASGWITSATRVADCATSMWLLGEPRVGTTVTFCRNGQRACHDCMWVSLFPGPTSVGGITAPIGFPLLAVLSGSYFTELPLCFPMQIPDDPNLSGVPVYFLIATMDDNGPTGIPTFSFGDVFTVRLL
ncbi:MAG: hypothetical protein U1F36_12380 [Planctomycetota bacterium]